MAHLVHRQKAATRLLNLVIAIRPDKAKIRCNVYHHDKADDGINARPDYVVGYHSRCLWLRMRASYNMALDIYELHAFSNILFRHKYAFLSKICILMLLVTIIE